MELAKAYVQIIPSADGIKGSISDVLSGEADEAGSKTGSSIVSKVKGAIAAAGIGKALSATISEAANLQQSLGGIETLFKGSADKMKEYANQAYKNAGMSANSYMEQVTSFSASLIKSVGGDTNKAADAANQAIVDMSDNSNKMGTNIQDIQNAYQGFAKQNYTMLDNLKLGYGGTKTEMQRLLTDAQKLTGVKYDINNLNDVYSAIHAVQGELGITGTTSKEAESTLLGSFASMKASFTDFLGNLALGENIVPSLQNLVSTAGTFLFGNLIPMIGNIFTQIPTIISTLGPQLLTEGMNMLVNLSQGLVNGIPQFLSTALPMIQQFADYLAEQAPTLIDKGFEMLGNLVDGIINGLPVLISQLPQIITTFANIINDNMPTILIKGFELIKKFVMGIINAIPTVIANIPKIITAIVSVIQAFDWLNLGGKIIRFFGKGIKGMVSFIGSSAKGIFDAVIKWFNDLPSNLLNIGKDLVKGLWNGISDMTDWIIGKIQGFGDSILSGIKDFFGIHSPSKVFEKEVGKMLPLGLAIGVENNLNPVRKAMNELNNETFGMIDSDFSISTKGIQSDNSQLTKAINGLRDDIMSRPTTSYAINGITYDDGSNISSAMKEIVRAVKVERRV